MAKKFIKEEEESRGEESFDNKLDLLKYTTEVHARIKNDITSDFVLAKVKGDGIEEKKRDAMIELVADAFYTKILFETIKQKGRKLTWVEDEEVWAWRKLTEEEKKKITKEQKETFDLYLLRPQMMTIMSRNLEGNKMMEWLTGAAQEEKPEEEPQEEGIAKKVVKKITKNEEKEGKK